MDDQFIDQTRPPVRPGFRESLYARLSRVPAQKKSLGTLVFRFGLAISIVLTLLFTFSEPARAGVLNLIRQTAGFEVHETEELPIIESEPSFVFDQDSINAGLEKVSFKFALPAYTPEGYTLLDRVYYDQNTVLLDYLNDDQDQISLTILNTTEPPVLTGTNSAEEIQINGQPALLVHGAFVGGNWDYNLSGVTIYFKQDSLTYLLGQFSNQAKFQTPEDKNKMGLPLAELIRTAESIPLLKNYDHGVYYYTPQPIEEILNHPPFPLKVPGYLPEGFEPGEGIVAYSKAWVSLSWNNAAGENLNLMIQEDWKLTLQAGAEGAEEVSVNGLPAVIIRGDYLDGKWDETAPSRSLYWRDGGFIYTISSASLSEETLMTVAESIK